MDRDFGNWLAGFIDGEGCFGLYKRSDSPGWAARFFVKLRDDDADVLLMCRDTLGIGTIRYIREPNPAWGSQVLWTVSSRADRLALVAILDDCPLRAKKRKDYALWREAVLLMEKVVQHAGNARTKELNEPIWQRLAELKRLLSEERRYVTQ
jgi:hypothetical protein